MSLIFVVVESWESISSMFSCINSIAPRRGTLGAEPGPNTKGTDHCLHAAEGTVSALGGPLTAPGTISARVEKCEYDLAGMDGTYLKCVGADLDALAATKIRHDHAVVPPWHHFRRSEDTLTLLLCQ
jgi:hypothetical protein